MSTFHTSHSTDMIQSHTFAHKAALGLSPLPTLEPSVFNGSESRCWRQFQSSLMGELLFLKWVSKLRWVVSAQSHPLQDLT